MIIQFQNTISHIVSIIFPKLYPVTGVQICDVLFCSLAEVYYINTTKIRIIFTGAGIIWIFLCKNKINRLFIHSSAASAKSVFILVPSQPRT